MSSRMNRYDRVSAKTMTRSARNKELYSTLNNNQTYTTYTDINQTNAVVIDAAQKNYRTREGYQKIKEYNDLIPQPKVKRELDDFNNFYRDRGNKIYDINSVIEEAKRNRIKKDELEEKRKLKNTSYNILASLNKEELERYKREMHKVIRADQEDIKEIINTITTKTINGEIDQETGVNLLSDLMATQAMDRIEGITSDKDAERTDNEEEVVSKKIDTEEQIGISQKLNTSDIELVKEKEIEVIKKEKEYKEKNQDKNIFKDMDQSFYTRSMDLSDKDFETGDGELKKESVALKVVKTIIILIFLAVAAVLLYYIITKYLV